LGRLWVGGQVSAVVFCIGLNLEARSVVCAGLREKRAGVDQQLIVHVGGWADSAEQEANARLIASAPDLLASLEEVLAYCREHGHDWACMAEAQAAINKATGEQA
jgi:hypothetical protein